MSSPWAKGVTRLWWRGSLVDLACGLQASRSRGGALTWGDYRGGDGHLVDRRIRAKLALGCLVHYNIEALVGTHFQSMWGETRRMLRSTLLFTPSLDTTCSTPSVYYTTLRLRLTMLVWEDMWRIWSSLCVMRIWRYDTLVVTILGLRRGRRWCGIRLCKTIKDLWSKIASL
jgi:hypothetical protein